MKELWKLVSIWQSLEKIVVLSILFEDKMSTMHKCLVESCMAKTVDA